MTSEASDPQAHRWAAVCHASGLLVFVTGGIGGVLGPLAVWALKRRSSPFVDDQGRQAINFQITIILGVIAGGVLLATTSGFGLILLGLVYTWDLIMICIATSRAWQGQSYRYPWTLILLRANA